MADLSSLPGIGSLPSLQGRFPTELPQLQPEGNKVQQPFGQPAPRPEGASFGDTLSGLVNNVDQITKNSHEATRRMLTGEVEDVHQVMVAVEEASTSFQLMMEIRNKIVEAYREVMRMQV